MAEPQQQQQTKPRTRTWNVMVRHSAFLLKNVDVEAGSPEEAKAKFFEMAKKLHDERAARVALQKGLDAQTIATTQQNIRKAYEQAYAERDKLEWIIRPADEVKAERQRLKDRIERRWGSAEREEAVA